jgi:hypothetical protein
MNHHDDIEKIRHSEWITELYGWSEGDIDENGDLIDLCYEKEGRGDAR